MSTKMSTKDPDYEMASTMPVGACHYGYLTATAYLVKGHRATVCEEARVESNCTVDPAVYQRTVDNLQAALMSSGIDYISSVGWPMSIREFVGLLYAGQNLSIPLSAVPLEDTEVASHTLTEPLPLRNIGVIGSHATLALEVVEAWKYIFPGTTYDVQILEENTGNKLCRLLGVCATDPRFAQLMEEHFGSVTLPIARMSNPVIDDLKAFLSNFTAMFGSFTGAFEQDKQVFICTEPIVICWALRLAFPNHTIVGYFGVPLLAYVSMQTKDVQFEWLQTFATIENFLPVANNLFLAEQIRYQTGRRLATVRPVCLYLDASYNPQSGNGIQVLVMKTPYVLWDTSCVLGYFATLNKINAYFTHSDEIPKTTSYLPFSYYHAVLLMPYDVAQMRFYEFYAMGVPMFIPGPESLPSYIYRGVTAVPDFDLSLETPDKASMPNPFRGHEHWPTAVYWARYTHFAQLPELKYFDSYMELFDQLDDMIRQPVSLLQASSRMKKRGFQDLLAAAKFWRSVFKSDQENEKK